ncbi:MAG: bifunctional metallophosphatase/5'-nucleotidase [Bacteroidales bacterium]|nr:bifunctional metallophosphatase/5'-nucleotidase [Bacteroidales bacterium]
MKRYLLILLAISAVAVSCSRKLTPANPAVPVTKASSDIVILYDNDVHCSVEGYEQMSALKAEKQKLTPYVTLVSSGDFVQGGSLGAVSRGGYIVEIMNAVGYDLVTLGNHEFDYGIPRLKELTSGLTALTLCCNLIDLRTDRRMFDPCRIVDYGGTKVAFIGVATPYSFNSSTPAYFQDDKGNYVYSLCADIFYDNVQNFVDDARAQGADYVVALTHLGDDVAYDPINSQTLAANTCGIDVILDGHSHSTVPSRMINATDGKPVLYTQTGAHFDNIGVLTIKPDGQISTELVPVKEYPGKDEKVASVIARIKKEYAEMGARKIGRSEVMLPAKDEYGDWLVRKYETSLGDFCADAFRITMDADIGVLGGGSIRKDLPAGDVRYDDIFNVFPFNNSTCIADLTGAQILDMLEFGVAAWPTDFGGFPQVSGLTYEFDPSVESPVVYDINKAFVRIDPGERRVRNVRVLDRKTGAYEPIDPGRRYKVAGTTYLLRDAGDGYEMLKGIGHDTGTPDVDRLENYIVEKLKGDISSETYGKSAGRVKAIGR